MRKTIAASVAALALAATIPLAATAGAGHDRHDGPHARGGHHGHMDGRMGGHDRMGHHRRGHHRGTGAKIRMMEMIDTYDANGDGRVTQEEVDQWRANRLAEFDADGDGQLSIEEYEQLWLDAMRERMVDAFQGHDDDGDGQVTVEEFGERTGRMVLWRDRNEDGVLDMNDLRRRHHDDRPDRPEPQDSDRPGAEGQPGAGQQPAAGQQPGAGQQQ